MTEAEDLELLQRHEPRLNFTYGELFFPMSAASYVESADLLEGPTLRDAKVAIPAGSLTLESLAAAGDPPPGQAQFLRFTPEPLESIELAALAEPAGPAGLLRPGPARAGRPGRPPRRRRARRSRSWPAAASRAAPRPPRRSATTRSAPRTRRSSTTAGSSARTAGSILHYMFLYAMNDWRSTFEGANDHEADWEQCFVVLEQLDDGDCEPAWFCAAAHDEKGDDLRRRWDDPRFQTIDGHPVVYPGAGSHATYLERGEYIMRLPFPGERNVHGPLDLLRRVWRDTLDQPDPGDLAEGAKRAFSVPFVDYARGDGIKIGPGGDIAWTPIIDQRRRPAGSTATTACGGSTPATGSPASAPRPVRSTPAPARSASPGTTRSASPVSTRWPRRPRRSRSSRRGSRTSPREQADAKAEIEALEASLPLLEAEVAAVRVAPGVEKYRAARAVELHSGEAKLAAAADQGRGARDGDRGGRATPDRAARRVRRRSARPPPPRRRPRAAGRHPATPAGRDLGRPQRRPARRRPGRDHLVPHPVAGRGDRRAVRHLPGDRVVLPEGRGSADPS